MHQRLVPNWLPRVILGQFSEDSKYFGIARAGNVIGGGDWAADRLIPVVIDHGQRKEVHARMPNATRPWQHVLEPISGYIALAEDCHLTLSITLNALISGLIFKPLPVGEVVAYLGKDRSVKIEEETSEANLLALNCDKAKFLLGGFLNLTKKAR